jgi:hypothetical protein
MIFYHYTTREALDAIRAEGLIYGEAPFNDRRVAQAVNLTTDPEPTGHGLDLGGYIVTEEHSLQLSRSGLNVPAGTRFVNKKEARISLSLPLSDTRLKSWRTWSRKNCDPGYPARLEAAAGAMPQKAKTWWLYFGIIPPDRFLSIDILVPE